MYTVHGRGADLPFYQGSIWIQICTKMLQHSQTQPYDICNRVIYLTQTHLYVEHLTEKQVVFKVFVMTRPQVD